MKLFRILLIALTATLCGCAYHQPFQQGNIITTAKVQAIHAGMTEAQVIAQLGSPVLKNVFSDNRMNYIYTSQPTRKLTIVKKLIIDFQNGHVVNIRTDL